ncbi:MAG: uracil-DNA glycosylase [Chloroflexi bacterium]|nr:uracil-DNA glycosylase [Chloroflexota bacterium]
MNNDPDGYRSLDEVNAAITDCRLCPRLVAYREEVARVKRRAFIDQVYWGRPVPGWGDPRARIWVIGLAPAAHGGNRTGRVFTGDRSGDFLYAALYRAGYANQPESYAIDDGLQLRDVYVSAAVRCAPPDNKPTTGEFDNCRPYLGADLRALAQLRVILALGKIAFDNALRVLAASGLALPAPRSLFGHGVAYTIGPYELIASYHPSQRNTQTGLLTARMMDEVMDQVRAVIARPSGATR